MRARRGRKPIERLEHISEWDGFTNPTRNPAYTKVFRAAGYGSADDLGTQAIRQIEARKRCNQMRGRMSACSQASSRGINRDRDRVLESG